MAFELVGGTMVLVHGTRTPTVEEWSEYVDQVRQSSLPPNKTVDRLLVWSGGAGPNATMRKQVVAAYADNTVPVAICSTSPVALPSLGG